MLPIEEQQHREFVYLFINHITAATEIARKKLEGVGISGCFR